MHFAQNKSLAAEVAATAMATLWKEKAGADTAKPTKWTYDQGVVLLGIERLWIQTANPEYFSYMQKSMDYFVSDNGDIKFYKAQDYNIDNILCGRILLTLYNVTGQAKYYKAATLLRDQLKGQPRTKEGGFWHKKIYPNQMWLDGLYMGQPFYTAYAKQFHEPEAFDDIANHSFGWSSTQEMLKQVCCIMDGMKVKNKNGPILLRVALLIFGAGPWVGTKWHL